MDVQFRAMKVIAPFLLFAVVLTGCDHEDRIAKLEKQTSELQSGRDRVADYDLQAKCAKDAKAWFNENWSGDKNTLLLDFMNHYNKKENKCFVSVEYHYNSKFAAPGDYSWTNDMTLWNLYENTKYGSFAETHYTYLKPNSNNRNEVIMCEVFGEKCKTLQEFNTLVRPYLND